MNCMPHHEDEELECRDKYVATQARVCGDMKRTKRIAQKYRKLYAAAYKALCRGMEDAGKKYAGAYR